MLNINGRNGIFKCGKLFIARLAKILLNQDKEKEDGDYIINGSDDHVAQELESENGPVISSKYPWMVGIYRKEDNEEKFHCGGSLISKKVCILWWDYDIALDLKPKALEVLRAKFDMRM